MIRPMLLPVLLLLASAGLGYLSGVDRASTLALDIVEIEQRVGVALWIPFAVAGLGLLAQRFVRRRRPESAVRPRPLTRDATRAAPAGPDPSGAADWLAVLRARAREVSDDAMGRVRFDEAPGVPFTLVLTAVTPEQARRRLAAFASWLATIPLPPVARVRVVSSPDLVGPLHTVLRGELIRHFPATAFSAVSRQDGVDVLFGQPDARWTAPPG